MKVYVVEIYDDLLEDSAIYGRAYLTRSAAQKRADRVTGEEDGVKTWARVCELEVAGEPVVGRETCRDVCEPPKSEAWPFWPTPHFKCSECGMTHVSTDYVFFCPNCGRRVVE